MTDKQTILVVEDDVYLRQAYVQKLKLAGYTVRQADNGQEAIDAIERSTPDLVVLDIMMPVKDGFEVLKAFPREKRSFSVILMTNFGDEEKRIKANELEADSFLVKNELSMKALAEEVAKHL